MPKAVMISHDNYCLLFKTFLNRTLKTKNTVNGKERTLSYLPLSHVAGQLQDILSPCINGGNLFIADPSVLQGNMLKFLLACRP